MTALPATSDDGAFWDLWLTPYYLPCITAADEIGTFAAISGEALTTDDLAQKVSAEPRALGVHLGLLAALGMVERRAGKWRATAMARTWMHPEAEGYYGPLLGSFQDGMPLHRQMVETLQTGEKGADSLSFTAEWERGALPQDLADNIASFMNCHSIAAAKAVAKLSAISSTGKLLDIGGGSAIFSIEMARANAALHATVLEIDTMCISAQRYIDDADAGDRVSTIAVDMFRQDWPTGYDAHFFSNIFHDWSDETCKLLAGKSFAALPSGGRIMLHEILMDDDGTGPLIAAAFSMLMLLGTKGRQYSLPEFTDILESVGFVNVQAERTGGGYYSLVTADKP
ncbi:MAG: methyltransferase [Parasphingorhabdus sp.]